MLKSQLLVEDVEVELLVLVVDVVEVLEVVVADATMYFFVMLVYRVPFYAVQVGQWSGLVLKPLLGSISEPKEKVLAQCMCVLHVC